MISGFKWDLRGAQHHFGVKPDLATWGKGIANGFSCCALTGRAEIMEIGGIRRKGEQKVFLISTTHGAETTGLAAMIATIDAFERERMIESNWRRGEQIVQGVNRLIAHHGLGAYLELAGDPCLTALICRNADRKPDDAYRTLFMQEMIASGVLFQGLFYPTWSHQQSEIDEMLGAVDLACATYARAIESRSCEGSLVGPAAQPVFRKRI
jgi:glutamate-1-semialdehyde 2,1-aminomutase